MSRRFRFLSLSLLLLIAAGGLMISPLFRATSAQDNNRQDSQIGEAAVRQIQELIAEKQSRTPAQRKISSQLLYAAKSRRGEAVTPNAQAMRTRAEIDEQGFVTVDIKANVSKELIEMIEKLGGQVVYGSDKSDTLRARLPLDSLETLATSPAVKSIRPAARAKTHRRRADAERTNHAAPNPGRSLSAGEVGRNSRRTDFAGRAANVRAKLPALMAAAARSKPAAALAIGSVTSQGDVAHRAAEARNFFGVNGAGVKVGVLSDSVDFLEQSQASGDLPNVTVLPGQSGVPGSGEGTAMLEIIHDLAPGAQLFFATAFISDVSFADNIRALRAAGCDVIVDDVIYANESPFQDGIIAKAVQDVTDDGALYFSSAGNQGNFNDGTSSVWEGDFRDGGEFALTPGGTVHDFGRGVISNRVESSSSFVLALFWSDAFGASGNDYDLFILNSTLTTVLDASTDIQDGDDDPFEIIFPGAFANQRIVVLKSTGAERRALHLNNFGGQLGIATDGETHGHSAVAKAFSTAAVNVAVAGGGPFTGGPSNPVELFSSDGPRRVFYDSEGTPYTPGRLLFRNFGGEVRRKPDLAAADGVATSVPGFNPFFGTSAAAPHAAAIAALLKSARPFLPQNRIRRALTETALDIEAQGDDRDSGAGIVTAFDALLDINAQPSPFIELGTVTATPTSGDGDAFIEPGESASLTVQLINVGGATALNVNATLTTSTPGVTITSGTSAYPNITSGGGSATNSTPFTFTLAPDAPCGLLIEFTLTVTYANGNLSPQVFNFTVQTGQPSAGSTTVSYTGPPVPIPDANAAGVSVPIQVSGLNSISDLNFRFDGSACTSAAGATTVGLDHTWVGDLVVTLTSPEGTTVTLMNRPGGTFNSGNNFCNTLLDDQGGGPSIQSITPTGAPPLGPPYTGTFRSASPLAAFNGENPNGTWTLRVSDLVFTDFGNVRAFSLIISEFNCN